MRYVEPRVSETGAWQFFERRRLGNLFGLLSRRRSSSEGLPKIELVWLPYYLIQFRVTRPRKGPGEVDVSVEGHSSAFAYCHLRDALADGTREESTFAPKLSEDEAVASGRRDLLKNIMRRRGQYGKPVIEEVLSIDLFHYPIWVCYYERRRGFIDIHIQDAYTGEKGGQRTKVGVLSALVSSDSAATAALEQNASDTPPKHDLD